MLSFFNTLQGKVITVELKNGIRIRGTLTSVDQYTNLKLDNITSMNQPEHPQFVSPLLIHVPSFA